MCSIVKWVVTFMVLPPPKFKVQYSVPNAMTPPSTNEVLLATIDECTTSRPMVNSAVPCQVSVSQKTIVPDNGRHFSCAFAKGTITSSTPTTRTAPMNLNTDLRITISFPSMQRGSQTRLRGCCVSNGGNCSSREAKRNQFIRQMHGAFLQ